jgi:membrane protein DedA with SNARE-associated domain
MWARAVDGLLTSVLDGVRTWLESHEGPLAYLVLALAAMLEYVVPPLPGDTIALFGVSLASTAGWNPWAIYAALNAGAIAGGQLAYSAGRYFGPRARRPAFLRGKRVEAELERVIVLFRERGAIALALNRFVPAFRSVFFVGAGIAELPALSVFGWGALSALLWNALLVGLGWALGATLSALESGVRIYAGVAFAVLAVALVVVVIRRRTKGTRSENAPGAKATSAPSDEGSRPEQE